MLCLVMIILGIFSLITAVALPNVNITPILLARVASIVLLYAAALSYNVLDIQAIGSGVSIYNELFQVTHVLCDTFTFFTGAMILLPWAPVINRSTSQPTVSLIVYVDCMYIFLVLFTCSIMTLVPFIFTAIPVLSFSVLLLFSGTATMTYTYYAFIEGNQRAAIGGVALTIILAVMFTALQRLGWQTVDFTIINEIYASNLFFAIGLHGFMLIGTIFIANKVYWYCLNKTVNTIFSQFSSVKKMQLNRVLTIKAYYYLYRPFALACIYIRYHCFVMFNVFALGVGKLIFLIAFGFEQFALLFDLPFDSDSLSGLHVSDRQKREFIKNKVAQAEKSILRQYPNREDREAIKNAPRDEKGILDPDKLPEGLEYPNWGLNAGIPIETSALDTARPVQNRFGNFITGLTRGVTANAVEPVMGPTVGAGVGAAAGGTVSLAATGLEVYNNQSLAINGGDPVLQDRHTSRVRAKMKDPEPENTIENFTEMSVIPSIFTTPEFISLINNNALSVLIAVFLIKIPQFVKYFTLSPRTIVLLNIIIKYRWIIVFIILRPFIYELLILLTI